MSDSEKRVQALVQLDAARTGSWLLRNNSGAFEDEAGRQVRFGLGNTSAKFNKAMKSADLVGIRPVLITAEMVGQTIGQFYAVECKAEDWAFKGTEREIAQKKFLDKCNELGGKGVFFNGSIETTGEAPYADPLVRNKII